jgi:hypothetical protein
MYGHLTIYVTDQPCFIPEGQAGERISEEDLVPPGPLPLSLTHLSSVDYKKPGSNQK